MYALLFSQEPDEAAILSVVLQRTGMSIAKSSKLDRAIQIALEQPAELILMAPKEDSAGTAVRRFRAETTAILVVITPQIEEESQIDLLEVGADLVIPRPFSARLLISQLRALLRRSTGAPFHSLPTLAVAGLTLDPETRTIHASGRETKRLTQLEFRLIYTLMVHRNQVVPAETLVEHIWGYTGQGDRDLIRGLIRRLRAKIEPDPATPQYILTVPGVGYSFNTD